MKILVTLLSTIENEYEECIQSIKSQKYLGFVLYEIKNEPKNTAHDLMYSHFMQNSDTYDLLVKIDADMVIADAQLFNKIVNEFEENKTLDRLFIPVYDHFVGENLGGVNVYRNTVKWGKNVDNYFTDKTHVEDSIREFKKWNPSVIDPLIHHCPNPSDFQAFHFGLHRAIKALQLGKIFAVPSYSRWRIFKKIRSNYIQDEKRMLLLAMLGCYTAVKNKLSQEHINYSNEDTLTLFEKKYKDLNDNEKIDELLKWFDQFNDKKDFYRLFLKTRI